MHALLDSPAELPDNLKINIFLGDAIKTYSAVSIDSKGGVELTKLVPGDGLVPRSSVMLDERLDGQWGPRLRTNLSWSNLTFLNAEHLELTEDPTFSDNLLFQLLESPKL